MQYQASANTLLLTKIPVGRDQTVKRSAIAATCPPARLHQESRSIQVAVEKGRYVCPANSFFGNRGSGRHTHRPKEVVGWRGRAHPVDEFDILTRGKWRFLHFYSCKHRNRPLDKGGPCREQATATLRRLLWHLWTRASPTQTAGCRLTQQAPYG